jgi:hypothetical protein
MSSIKYVGMDAHKSITVIVILNAAGQIESRTQVKTKAENFRDFFRGLSGRVEGVLPVNRPVSVLCWHISCKLHYLQESSASLMRSKMNDFQWRCRLNKRIEY